MYVTVACAFPAVAVPMVGASGVVVGTIGVTEFETPELAEDPSEFLAVTVKLYDVPFVRPVTTA